MNAAAPDLIRASRVPLLLAAVICLLAGCGTLLPAAEPAPPRPGDVCGEEASRCPLCGESPCVGGCPACDLSISAEGSGAFADSGDPLSVAVAHAPPVGVCPGCWDWPCTCDRPVDGELPPPPQPPRATFDPTKPAVVLVTADGCPPCKDAAAVAVAAEASGVQVLTVKVDLCGAVTPTWYRVDLSSEAVGPLDVDRVSALATPPELDRGFSTVVPAADAGLPPLPGSPPLPPGHRILRRESAPATAPVGPPPAPRPMKGPGCGAGCRSCPRR